MLPMSAAVMAAAAAVTARAPAATVTTAEAAEAAAAVAAAAATAAASASVACAHQGKSCARPVFEFPSMFVLRLVFSLESKACSQIVFILVCLCVHTNAQAFTISAFLVGGMLTRILHWNLPPTAWLLAT